MNPKYAIGTGADRDRRFTEMKSSIDVAHETAIRAIGDNLGVDWNVTSWDEFQIGYTVELEHGTMYGPAYNITNDDPVMTAKIALVHLHEVSNYYSLLKKYVDPN